MLAVMTRVLVAMQLMRVGLTLSTVATLGDQASTKPRSAIFLDRADPLDKMNKEALTIRKKLDSLALQCKMAQFKDKDTLDSLHRELRIVSGQLAGNVAQLNDARNSASRGKSGSEKLKVQLRKIHNMCESQKKHVDAAAEALLRDQGRAKALRALSSQCSFAALVTIHAKVPPPPTSLLQGCKEELFAGEALEQEASNFSTPFAKQAFRDAWQHASAGSTPSAFLASKAWPSESKPRSKAKAKAASACKLDKGVASCGLLNSQFDALAKHLEEQKDVAVTEQRKSLERCIGREKQINDHIKSSDSQTAQSSAELVRLTGIQAGFAASRTSITQRLERAQRDADQFQKTCESGIDEYKGELEDLLKKRQAVANKAAGKRVAIQDCVVHEWVFSKCSKQCKKQDNETAGVMKASRSVIQVAGMEGTPCPQLFHEFSCNDKPCPTDCAVQEWAKWSMCSKACGGGTSKRTRRVVTQPKDDGKACPLIEQRKMCNVGRCSDECKLKDWTPWSACTRRCKFSANSAAGQQHRTREVLGNPGKATATCLAADDERRLQVQACNEEACPKDVTCDASQDVLLLLDGSGDAGVNFEHQRSLVASIAEHSTSKVRFGVVAYGKEVEILSRITANRTQLAAISAYAPPVGGSRDCGKGEVVGRTLFMDPGVGRGSSKVAVLLLGGAPAGFVSAKKAAEELRSAGVRLVVGLVDDGSPLARKQACSLVNEPCSANVEAVASWEQMAQEPGRFLAAICPA